MAEKSAYDLYAPRKCEKCAGSGTYKALRAKPWLDELGSGFAITYQCTSCGHTKTVIHRGKLRP